MLKRKILAVAVSSALSTGAMATTFHNHGSVLGYGDAGNNHTLFANFKNPAFLGGDDTNREWGIGLSGGIELETKDITGVEDAFNTMNDRLTEIEAGIGSTYITLPPLVSDTLGAVNNFLDDNEKVQLNIKASGSVPLVVQTTNFGGYMLSASITRGYAGQLLRDGKAVQKPKAAYAPNTKVSDYIDTNAAFNVQTYQMTEFALAYSADLNRFFKPQNGQINAGIRLKMMNASFNHATLAFDDVLADSDDLNKQFENTAKLADDYSDSDSQLGVDFGVQYIATNYLVGLSLENINSPKFNYNFVTPNAQFDSMLKKNITFEPKARLEAATYSQNRRWTFAGFADLNKTMDISGHETQKAGVATAYASNKWYLPDLRAGYTNESAGYENSRLHAGLTVGFLSLDLATSSFDSLTKMIDGKDYKDGYTAVNASVEFSF